MSTMVELATQQKDALEAIEAWWDVSGPERTQVFRLFGFAGTGKTTIAKLVPGVLGIEGRVRFAAYTGKAAHVLERKGCTPVSTIHSLIYRPIEVLTECPYGEHCDSPRDERTGRCAHEVKRLEFTLKETLEEGGQQDDSDLEQGDSDRWPYTDTSIALLILDEVSMVSDELARDLLSFGVRVLVLGDPAQLPPIAGTGYFTAAEPDVMLTKVHRQAAESPVLRLATAIREGRYASARNINKPSMAELHAAGQILVWKNRTRWSVVETLRGALGRPAGTPVPGDRVICLANNRTLGVFNGQQFWVVAADVTQVDSDGRPAMYRMHLVDEQPRTYELDVMAGGFHDQKGEEEVRRNGSRGKWAAMTFAQAITVHKAQGSEWDKVIVIDESSGLEWMTNKRGEDGAAMRRMWLYTAITRASDEVVLADARGW